MLCLMLLLLMLLSGCGPKHILVPHEVVGNPAAVDSLWQPLILIDPPVTYGDYIKDSYYMRAVAEAYEERLNEIRQAYHSLKCTPVSF